VNSSLVELRLIENKIGNRGANAFAEALKANFSLCLLNLRSNEIDDSGASFLAEALMLNKTIETFYIDFNCIGANGEKKLKKAKTSRTFETFLM